MFSYCATCKQRKFVQISQGICKTLRHKYSKIYNNRAKLSLFSVYFWVIDGLVEIMNFQIYLLVSVLMSNQYSRDTMNRSKQIGGLVGPIMVATIISEFPLVQPRLYDTQIPPVVYLSGTLMFSGGLTIVRAHNRWARNWTALLTLSGWFFMILGLFRMFAAGAYLQGSENTSTRTFIIIEVVLLLIGLIITFKSYTGGKE